VSSTVDRPAAPDVLGSDAALDALADRVVTLARHSLYPELRP